MVLGIERNCDAVGCMRVGSARAKDRDDGATVGIRPIIAHDGATLRMTPLDIRNSAFVDGSAGEPAIVTQRRVAFSQIDERGNERDECLVDVRPIDPRQRAILRVRVVVALLRASKLVAHRKHRGAARDQQGGEQVATVAASRRADFGVGCRPFDAVIPRPVDGAAIDVVLAVGLVMFRCVGNEIGEGKAIVRSDEIDRPRRGASTRLEDVGGARDACRKVTGERAVAAPESSYRVAIAVIPFAPPRWERAKAMSAGPDVPRFGNQLEIAQHWILRDCLQQRCLGIERIVPSAERGRKIEPKPIDTCCVGVVAQDVQSKAEHRRSVERQRIAAACVIDIMHAIARNGTVVARVVEPTQRQCRSERIALAGVVENHVEDHFDAGGLKGSHASAKLVDSSRRKPRIGYKQRDGVVTPVVGEAEGRR